MSLPGGGSTDPHNAKAMVRSRYPFTMQPTLDQEPIPEVFRHRRWRMQFKIDQLRYLIEHHAPTRRHTE